MLQAHLRKGQQQSSNSLTLGPILFCPLRQCAMHLHCNPVLTKKQTPEPSLTSIISPTDTDVIVPAMDDPPKRSLQRKSGFHLVCERTSTTFMHTRFLLSFSHILRQGCQCFFAMTGCDIVSFFFASKGNGKA